MALGELLIDFFQTKKSDNENFVKKFESLIHIPCDFFYVGQMKGIHFCIF